MTDPIETAAKEPAAWYFNEGDTGLYPSEDQLMEKIATAIRKQVVKALMDLTGYSVKEAPGMNVVTVDTILIEHNRVKKGECVCHGTGYVSVDGKLDLCPKCGKGK